MIINYVNLFGCLVLLVFPYLISSLGSSSLAIGTLIGVLFVLSIKLISGAHQYFSASRLFFVFMFLAVNIVVTSVYYNQIFVPVQFQSMLLLGLLFIFSESLARSLRYLDDVQARSYNFYVVGILLGSSLISMFNNFKFVLGPKSILYFSEPSLFSLAISPFLLYAILSANRLVCSSFLIIFIVETIYCESTVMLVLTSFCALIYIFRFSSSAYLKLAYLALLLIACNQYILSNNYYSSRIFLDDQNVSSLVYQRGVEASLVSLLSPPFIGVGFQMMSVRSPITLTVDKLEKLYLGQLNIHDGGTLGAKFVTEFGWMGLIVLIFFLFINVPELFFSLSKLSGKKALQGDYIYIACTISVFIQLFVRGSGYLGPSFVLSYLSIGFHPSIGWLRGKK